MNREIRYNAWATKGKRIVDLKAITPMALDKGVLDEGDGLFIPFRKDIILMELAGIIGGVEIWEHCIYSAKFKTKKGITEVKGKIAMDDFMWCLMSEEEIYSINRLHDFELLGNVFETETN